MPDPRPDDRPLVPARVARGARGAVVAPHHLATAAGLAVLAAGGHAVDAAIATVRSPSRFRAFSNAGHASTEPGIIDGLVRATDQAFAVVKG